MGKHNRQVKSDIGLGLETVAGRAASILRAFRTLTVIGVAGWLVLGGCDLYTKTTPSDRYAAAKWAEAWFVSSVMAAPNFKIMWGGDDIEAGRIYRWPQLRDGLAERAAHMKVILGQDAAISAAAVAMLAFLLRRLGSRLRGDHMLRGGRVVSDKELSKEVRRRGQASHLHVGRVPLVAGTEVQHLALIGSPGTGKTELLHGVIEQIGRAWGLLIYDTKLALQAHHFKPGDVIFNPTDARCPKWTPWDEIESSSDAWTVAHAFVPENRQANDQFWEKAAQQLLADLLVCIPPKMRTNAELFRLCVQAGNEELKALLVGTPSERLFTDADAGRMRESVRGTLAIHLRGLLFLVPNAVPGEGFSMRRWIRQVLASGNGQRVFLGCQPQESAALTPLISVLIESAVTALMALGPDAKRRLGFVIDEFPTLPAMKNLQRLLAEGRGYGAVAILAAQNHAQIRATYGQDGAESITSHCSTNVVFRVNHGESAERASRLLGEAEWDEARESDVRGTRNASTSLAGQRVVRRLVLAGQILSLSDLCCYVKLSGDYPVALAKLRYQERTATTKPFVARPNAGPRRPPIAPSATKPQPDNGLL